jgi:hypothetical protein
LEAVPSESEGFPAHYLGLAIANCQLKIVNRKSMVAGGVYVCKNGMFAIVSRFMRRRFQLGLFLGYRVYAAEAEPKPLKSQVVNWDDAQLQQADWGQMRTYFRGETHGTKDILGAGDVLASRDDR